MHLRLHEGGIAGSPSEDLSNPELARFFLRFELDHSREVQQALSELMARVRGERSALVSPSPAQLGELASFLDDELTGRRVEIGFEPLARALSPRDPLDLQLPSLGPAAKPEPESSFIALHLVDQNGAPVADRRFQIELPDGSVHAGATDPDGFGRVKGFTEDGTAKIIFPNLDELDFKTKGGATRVVTPVNNKPKPKDENAPESPADSALNLLDPALLDLEAPPKIGKLFVELFDKTGRVRHAKRTFQITGPVPFQGTTDDQGRLQQDNVPAGDYSLSLALDFFLDEPDAVVDIMDVPLVVLAPEAKDPQVRLIGAVPRSTLARLQMFFNTNKTFLLPTALPAVRKLRRLYRDNAPCKLLVVGHADTRGGPAYNDKLSLERAKATIAYLKDDVDAWLAFYGDSDTKKCWGKSEDHLMIMSLPDFVDKPKGENEVRFFQRTRGLQVDGTAGDETRRALIEEYMALDGASLADFVGEIDAIAHGCGENFPLDDSGENLDAEPADEKRDQIDRRVELYFFDSEFGVTPPPPGDNSGPGAIEYPLWRKRVTEVVELRAGDLDGPAVTFVELSDAHFRLDSAVVLPEGERPDATGAHGALTSVGLFATVLRFNEEHPGHSLFIAGHTDTSAGDTVNDELSRQRADLALALLLGDRESFKTLATARHKGSDINQILSWLTRAFDNLTFDCAPQAIKDTVSDVTVRKFQNEYNRNKKSLGATALDLVPDGSFGKLAWGAVFDCYEFALQQELGETAAGLAALRAKLQFTDDKRKALGFGERFPIEELGVDEFRSETNRRVEILFFESGEEPDLAHAEADPETSELYLPGNFARTALEPLLSARPFRASWSGTTANSSTPRTMNVTTPGLPDGTPVDLILFVNGLPLRAFELKASAGAAAFTYTDWDAPEELTPVQLKAGEPFPPAVYTFVVQGAGRVVNSQNAVTYADRVHVKLVLDPQDGDPEIVLQQENYVLQTPFGSRAGQTDKAGILDELGVPPGGASLLLRGRHLIHLGTVPSNWDAAP